MENQHRRIITENMIRLVEVTQWNPTMEQRLIQEKVLSENMIKGIKREEGRLLQTFYLKIQTRGPEAFSKLVEVLKDSNNVAAARVLDPSVPDDNRKSVTEHREKKVWSEPFYPQDEINSNLPEVPRIPISVAPADNDTPLEVKVRKSAAFKNTGWPMYRMRSKPRGYALIIDNEVFSRGLYSERTGTQIDSNNLDILFEQLGFNVRLRRNMTSNDMQREIDEFSRNPELSKTDMAVVCVLSHGREGGNIASSDGVHIQTERIIKKFNNDECPALRGKPKFFILQACRGDEIDYGAQRTFVDGVELDAQKTMPKTRSLPNTEAIPLGPSWEDILIAYSTIPGYVSNRDTIRGTWFIEALVQVFMERACEMDIKDMLDEVGNTLASYESERRTKQSFSYEVRHFTKKLFFNPGMYED